MPLAIETDRLCRSFAGRPAVDGVSLHVPARSVYGFLGRNGAGKTTTLKLLLGLLQPDSGSAHICGIDVAKDRLASARQIGALLEAHGFYPQLTGRENLDLTRRLRGLPASEINRVLDLAEMALHAGRPVSEYSQGMRQRLGLARALLGAPSVLILDEPTNGLDPEGIADMRVFLRSLPERTGATVLLSSHLLGEIEQTATHIGILSQGRLVLEGTLDQLRSGLACEVLIGTDTPERAQCVAKQHGFDLHATNDGLIARIPSGESPERAAASLNRVLCVAGVCVHALLPRRRSLESLYREAGQSAEHDASLPSPVAA